jgi:hypothetical protein
MSYLLIKFASLQSFNVAFLSIFYASKEAKDMDGNEHADYLTLHLDTN